MKHAPGVLCEVRASCGDQALAGRFVVIERLAAKGEKFMAGGVLVCLDCNCVQWVVRAAVAGQALQVTLTTVRQLIPGFPFAMKLSERVVDAMEIALHEADLKPLGGPGVDELDEIDERPPIDTGGVWV